MTQHRPSRLHALLSASLAALAVLALTATANPASVTDLPKTVLAAETRQTTLYTVPAPYVSQGRQYYLRTTVGFVGPRAVRPLVLVLHGYNSTASAVSAASGASIHSDSRGYDVAYPAGANARWNAGGCCGGANLNDVQFLKDVTNDIANRTGVVDRERVYVWGFSNGGMMAWKAACDAPEAFAAAGVMGGTLMTPCKTTNVIVRQVHGQGDTTVPWRGGYNSALQVTFPDNEQNRSKLTTGSLYAPKLIANASCGHTWATTGNACGFDATESFWVQLSQYRRSSV